MPEPPRIAVVDDEQPVRTALERLLRSAGFAVTCFESGAAFLRSLAEREPSCVVLDLHMPPPNGFEILKVLSRNGRGIPVVAISAEYSAQNCARVIAQGANTLLAKPVDDALLLEAVGTAVMSGGA